MNLGLERTPVEASLLDKEQDQPYAGIADSPPPPESGRTFPSTTSGPTSVVVTADGPGLAAGRRTFGVVSDQASSNGAVPAAAWLILPTVAGSPSHPGLVLANPGSVPAEITLSRVGSADAPITITIPANRTAAAPGDFLEGDPEGAVLAIAASGTFVPASASYSFGREGSATYAVALGIPIPDGWAPT
jgi:hypothetical protein